MGLAEVQKTLARLYTDRELRERFYRDPLLTGRELGLSGEEARRLAQLSAGEVEKFAGSLDGKRLLGVSKLLPFTRRVLREDFDAHFRRYAAAHRHVGAPEYFQEASLFAGNLEKVLRRAGETRPWLLDLLRFERARVLAADPRRRLVARYFRHDIGRLVRSLARREEAPAVARRPSFALWWRTRPHAPVRYAVLSAPRFFGRKPVPGAKI